MEGGEIIRKQSAENFPAREKIYSAADGVGANRVLLIPN